MKRVIVREAVEEAGACCDGAGVRAFVESAEIFEGGCPWVGGVEEGWGDGWEGHCCGLCDGDMGWWYGRGI